MWRCPICGKEHSEGFVCGDCGFDLSCDYERNRTLCSVLPRNVKPISVHSRERRKAAMLTPETFSCPKCGKKLFLFSTDIMGLVCMDCGARVSLSDLFALESMADIGTHNQDGPLASIWKLQEALYKAQRRAAGLSGILRNLEKGNRRMERTKGKIESLRAGAAGVIDAAEENAGGKGEGQV